MTYLLDTDVCSAIFRRHPAASRSAAQFAAELAISVITLGELQTWASRRNSSPTRQVALDTFAADATVLDVNQPVARRFGVLRAGLLDAGHPLPTPDLLIAATALEHGLTVVTHNVRHYREVPGLLVEDWLAP